MNKLSLFSSIVQAISGLTLIGIAIYYYLSNDMTKFWVFLAVGAVFVVLPIRTVYKYIKGKQDKKREEENKNRHDFI